MAPKAKQSGTTDPKLNQLIVNAALENEAAACELHRRLYVVLKLLFSTRVVGADNIPDKPVLLVGNHSTLALDVPLIQSSFLQASGRLPFAMADKVLFGNSTLRNMMKRQGGILGHPEVCSAMMNNGKDLLVFPGGSLEVNKPIEERYKLKWKERYGFVRLALEHGYTLLPVATVGPDEFYGRYMEGPEWFNSWIGKFLVSRGILDADMRDDLLPPIPRGVMGTLLPKPQPVYVSFGAPIDLSQETIASENKVRLQEIRARVADSIDEQIRDLLLLRVQQSDTVGWLRKLLTR